MTNPRPKKPSDENVASEGEQVQPIAPMGCARCVDHLRNLEAQAVEIDRLRASLHYTRALNHAREEAISAFSLKMQRINHGRIDLDE